MRLAALGRTIAFALSIAILLGTLAQAHPLPGSTLTLSIEDEQLTLSITLPIEDLVIAAPQLHPLETQALGQDLPPEVLSTVTAYFDQHLSIEHPSSALPLTLTGATLQTAQTEEAGQFTTLILSLTTPVPEALFDPGALFPLHLTYDAVMHEVRNHRATVFWTAPGAAALPLANFGFQTLGGVPISQTLHLP